MQDIAFSVDALDTKDFATFGVFVPPFIRVSFLVCVTFVKITCLGRGNSINIDVNSNNGVFFCAIVHE